MAYTTRSEVEALIPPPLLLRALDDNGDGTEDSGLFTTLQASADAQVNGMISTRYTLPLTAPYPDIVTQSALYFLLESIYQRNGVGAGVNPWSQQALQFREQLKRIGRGEIQMTPDVTPGLKAGRLACFDTPTDYNASVYTRRPTVEEFDGTGYY